MLSLLSAIGLPILKLLDGLFGYVSNVETTKLTTQAAVDEASITSMAQVETKWSFVAMMIPLFAIPYAVWTIKAVGWDKVIGPVFDYHSRTDALSGDLSKAYWIIITGIFLHAMSRS